MRKWRVSCFLFLALCLSFTFVSCRTTIEYVPVPVDITDVVNPVLEQRPDNSKITVKAEVESVEDILENSAAYFYAWETWESYADALEQTIGVIQERLLVEKEK